MHTNFQSLPSLSQNKYHSLSLIFSLSIVIIFQGWGIYSLLQIMSLNVGNEDRILIAKAFIGIILILNFLCFTAQATINWASPIEKHPDLSQAFNFGKFIIIFVLLSPVLDFAKRCFPELDRELSALSYGLISLVLFPNFTPTYLFPNHNNRRRFGIIIFCIFSFSIFIGINARKIGHEFYQVRQEKFGLVLSFDELRGAEIIRRNNGN